MSKISKDIEKLEKALASAATPEAVRPKLQEALDKLREKQKSESPAKPAAKEKIKRQPADTNKQSANKDADIAKKLMDIHYDTFNKLKTLSAGEIRRDHHKLHKYAFVTNHAIMKAGIEDDSLSENVYDIIAHENAHLLNEFLAWNYYFDPKTTKILQKSYYDAYEQDLKNGIYQNGVVARPESIAVNFENKDGVKRHRPDLEKLYGKNAEPETPKKPDSVKTLLEQIKSDPAYKDIDFRGTNIEVDAKRKAKPRGKRKSKQGNTYYENRENRSDHSTKGKIYLDKGGILLPDGSFQTFANYRNTQLCFSKGGNVNVKQPTYGDIESVIISAVYDMRKTQGDKEQKSDAKQDLQFFEGTGKIFDLTSEAYAPSFLQDLDLLPASAAGKEIISDTDYENAYYNLYDKLEQFVSAAYGAEIMASGGRTKQAHNKDHKYVNKDQSYEVDYANEHPGRRGYKKDKSTPDGRKSNGNALFAKAKEIRKPGEDWQAAVKRAKSLF